MRGSEAVEYLAEHAAYWINLDRAVDRYQTWTTASAPLFRSAVRVPAFDGLDVDDETADRFVADWCEAYADALDLGMYVQKPQNRFKYRVPTAKMNHAIRESHLKALRTGIESSSDTSDLDTTFFVAEDDVVPRSALWLEDVEAPPSTADIAIWSGGLAMNAMNTDSDAFIAGQRMTWVKVPRNQSFNCLGAGLYELNKHVAQYVIDETERTRMGPFDLAWGHALLDLTVYRLRPNGFAQIGQSIRNSAFRTPKIEREKATT